MYKINYPEPSDQSPCTLSFDIEMNNLYMYNDFSTLKIRNLCIGNT